MDSHGNGVDKNMLRRLERVFRVSIDCELMGDYHIPFLLM